VQVGHQSPGGGRSILGLGATSDAVAVGNGTVWVANGADGTLMKIDPIRNFVAKTISVGKGVDGITVGSGYVWVSRP
jgi:DNA-binding beta-propeller fold protein YncE